MSEKTYKYKQDERVYFNVGEGLPKGYGTVNGILGPIIILKMETAIKDYPFTHIYVTDNQIMPPPAL
jgi:hypothetical protein